MQINNRNEFHKIINDMGLKIGIEIGVWRGEFSEYLLRESNLETLYLCDSWCPREDLHKTNCVYGDNNGHEDSLRITISRVEKYKGRYEVVRLDSVEASKTFADNSLDFIYIDANHEYEACLIDCNAWYPKVRKGGVLSGHDYIDMEVDVGSFGVKSAMTKFCKDNNVQIQLTNEPLPSWWFVK